MVRAGVKGIATLVAAMATAVVWRDLERTKRDRDRLRSHWTTVGDLRMHARVSTPIVSGQRPAVVLVHGFIISSLYMVPTAARLASEFPVYAPDLPGFGKTDRPPVALDVSGLADALAAWMDSLGLRRVALVGHSLGSQVAADFAARFPGRVDRLVLLAPTVDESARTPWQQFARLLFDMIYERPSLVMLEGLDWMHAGVRVVFRTMRYALTDRIEDKLPQVSAPSMVVRGARDPSVSGPWTAKVARLLRTTRVVEIPKGGHAINYSNADALVAAMLPFLREEPTAHVVDEDSRALELASTDA